VAGHDAGVEVVCPGCGQTVLQKAMIPVVGEDGQGVRYLCIACARALISITPDSPAEPEPAEPA